MLAQGRKTKTAITEPAAPSTYWDQRAEGPGAELALRDGIISMLPCQRNQDASEQRSETGVCAAP